MIHDSPSTIYSYALLLSPSSSWLHQYYTSELSQQVTVIKGLPKWGKCFRIVQLHFRSKILVCCKSIIAIAIAGAKIIILNAITGSQVAVYSEHPCIVQCLTFSSDGKLLISGRNDGSIKLWDMQTGGAVKTFHRHALQVHSISVSGDCAMIASGSDDRTVRLWDIQTGVCSQIIPQIGSVVKVEFFPLNPNHLISVSGGKVWQWNINGHQIEPECNASYATYSLDGTKLAIFNHGVIQIKNPDSGAIIAEFHTPGASGKSCHFSPDGKLVAIATRSVIHVWDITSPDPYILETFHIGNGSCFSMGISMGFSSPTSLISVDGGPARFWQVGTPSTALDVTKSPIQSITLQMKDRIVLSSDSDGVVRIWDLRTGVCKKSFQTPAKGSCRRDIQLIDHKWIIVWHMAGKFHIWAIEKGKPLHTADIADKHVDDLWILGNEPKILFKSSHSLVILDIWTGKILSQVELSLPLAVRPFLAIDGSRVWIYNNGPRGWNFEFSDTSIGFCIAPPNRPHLDFVGGIRRYKSSLPTIEDTVTGKEFLRLPNSLNKPIDAKWDGQYLVSGYDTGDILILKCNCTISH